MGSINWLAHTTCPDLSTITSLLAQHQSNPFPGHLDAVKHAIKYIANTKELGILFTSKRRSTLESFLQFPLPPTIVSLSDANWGPQDAAIPTKTTECQELPLFASRSMSAFLIRLYGPLHWSSSRQTVTAGSSAETEIYCTDSCVKLLLELVQLLDFLTVRDMVMPGPVPLYNDNKACVDWSKSTTTKGLRHIQIKENKVRENILNKFVDVLKIDGSMNLSDLFTKEHRDVLHFIRLRDHIMSRRPSTDPSLTPASV